MIQYTNNTFAIFCYEVLERFVRARFQNKQHLAIRSLHLAICVCHPSNVDVWSNSISKAILKRLKSLRFLYLKLEQNYCPCLIGFCGYEGSKLTERQRKMFKKLSSLPLKNATLVIDDSLFRDSLDGNEMEQQYRVRHISALFLPFETPDIFSYACPHLRMRSLTPKCASGQWTKSKSSRRRLGTPYFSEAGRESGESK